MMIKPMRLVVGLGLVGMTAFALTAHAGWKVTGPEVNIGSNYFYGSLGAVRASGDTQSINCITYSATSGTSVSCLAYHPTLNAGNPAMASCSAWGAADWQPFASITPDSHIDVSFNDGICSTIRVNNASFWPITVP
jgi:hypothetical protein